MTATLTRQLITISDYLQRLRVWYWTRRLQQEKQMLAQLPVKHKEAIAYYEWQCHENKRITAQQRELREIACRHEIDNILVKLEMLK